MLLNKVGGVGHGNGALGALYKPLLRYFFQYAGKMLRGDPKKLGDLLVCEREREIGRFSSADSLLVDHYAQKKLHAVLRRQAAFCLQSHSLPADFLSK